MTINLRAAAIQAGYKNTDLARIFGVTPAAISKWLNRRVSVPDKLKRDFAATINVDVADLVPPAPSELQKAATENGA